MIPLDNFWDYIIIIFTFYYLDDDDELKERKEKLLKNYEEEFIPLISASKVQNIKSIEFSKIKKEFVNLKIKKTTKNMLSQIFSILKGNKNLEPLFHKVNIEKKYEEIIVMNKDSNSGDLYKVTYKN